MTLVGEGERSPRGDKKNKTRAAKGLYRNEGDTSAFHIRNSEDGEKCKATSKERREKLSGEWEFMTGQAESDLWAWRSPPS